MTKEINLTLRYLLPKKSLIVFLVTVFVGELINLIDLYFIGSMLTIKDLMHQLSGFIAVMLLPEIISFLGIIYTLKWAHQIFNIQKVKMTANGIAIYELKLILIIIISFYIYFPITYAVRLLLKGDAKIFIKTFLNLPFYNFYYTTLYIIPILFLGLIIANISLFYDAIDLNKKEDEITLKRKTDELIFLNTKNDIKENSIPLKTLKVKDENGFRDLKSNDIIYIQYSEIDKSRRVMFYHTGGIASMRMSLTEIESEIISLGIFFRISRNIIVNMNFIEEYIIDSNTKKMTLKLKGASFIPDVSRYRTNGFKKAYSEHNLSKHTTI